MSEKYSVEAILSLRDQGFSSGMQNAGNAVGKMRGGVSGLVGGITKMASAFGVGQLAVDGLRSAFRTVTSSIDGAISRVDTLDNADRVFANMGFAAEDTAIMMDNLNESITGLPTTLDGAIRNVQTLASSTQDVKGSEEIFSALNNAVLGFGGSAEGVDSVVNMFSRSLGRGKMQADEWNTMFDQMGPVLNAVATEMGYTSTELREGLSAGEIELDSFTEALLRMNKEGGGGLVSLEQIAQDSTKGIRTSFTNAKTAITRGVATVIQSLNEALENAGLMSISEMLTAYGANFNKVLLMIADNLQPLVNIVANVIEGFRSLGESFLSTNKLGIRLQNMFTNIRAAFGHVVRELFGGGGDISETFSKIGVALSNAITPLVTFVGGIYRYVTALDIAGMKNEVFARLQRLINRIDWQRLKELAITLKDGVGNAIMFVIEKIQELWAGFKESGAIDAIVRAFKEFVSMIGTTIESVGNLTGNMREGSISFEDIGNAIGKAVVFLADIVSWFYKTSASVGIFLSKVNPNIILGIVGAFAGFKFLERFNPFGRFSKNAEKGMGGVGRSARRGGGIIHQVFSGIGSVIESVARSIGTLLTSLAESISIVARGIARSLSIALRGLASAIRMIPIPHMLAFAVALGVVIAALTLLATQGDGVKSMLEGIAIVAGVVITAFGNTVVRAIEAFSNLLKENGDLIVRIVRTIGEAFSDFALAVGVAVGYVVEKLEPLVEIIKDGFVKAVEIISDAVVEIAEIISEYIPDILDTFDNLVEKIPDIIDAFGRFAESVGNAIATVIEAIGDNAQGIIKAFGDAFEQAGNVVIGIINALKESLPNLESFVTGVIEQLGESLPPIIEAFGEVFKDMGEAIEGVIDAFGRNEPQITNFTETVIGALGGAVVDIIKAFEQSFETMGRVVEGIIDAWGRNAPSFAEAVDIVITSMSEGAIGIIDAFKDAFSEMGDTIVRVVQAIEDYIHTFGQVIQDIITTLGGEIRSTMETFGQLWTDMGETVEGVINAMSEHNTALSEAIKGIIETLAGEIRDTIDSFTESFEKIGTTIEGVIEKIGEVSEDVAGAVSEFADAVEKLSDVDYNFLAPLAGFVGLMGILVPLRNQISQTAAAVDDLATAFDRIDQMESPTEPIISFDEAMQNIVNNREDFLGLLSGINEEFTDMPNNINMANAMFTGPFDEAVNGAISLLKSLDQQFLNMSNNIEQNINDAETSFVDGVKSMTLEASTFATNVGSTFTTFMTGLRTLFSTGLSTISQLFTTHLGMIDNFVRTSMFNINTQSGNTIRTMVSITRSGLSQITGAYQSNMRQSLWSVQSTMSSIINSMRSVYSPAYSAGYNAGLGFNRGLANTRNQIMWTANNIANSVAATMRRALQTRSPSRVLAGIGEDAGMGLYVGLDGMMPRIESMSKRMADLLDFETDGTDFTVSYGDDYHDVGREIVVHNKFELNGTEYRAFVEDIALEITRQRNKEF